MMEISVIEFCSRVEIIENECAASGAASCERQVSARGYTMHMAQHYARDVDVDARPRTSRDTQLKRNNSEEKR